MRLEAHVQGTARRLRLPSLVAFLALSCPAAAEEAGAAVRGRLLSPAGTPLGGVAVEAPDHGVATTTGEDGRFSLPILPEVGAVRLVVTLPDGSRQEVRAATAGEEDLVVGARAFREEITISASRVERSQRRQTADVTVLSAEELESTAALTLDDGLRRVPGFTLFRRSGSRAANPTTQGASLRGIGGSAASRALVLADGVPLNDPFGGWVAWGRVPKAAIGRVEVVRGGISDLYGTSALVGVVHLLRREPVPEGAVAFETSLGELGTWAVGGWASSGHGSWDGSLAADLLRTEGYVPVAPAERGAVDAPAGVEHVAIESTVGWEPDGVAWLHRAFLRAGWFDEERGNGTREQTNDTRIRDATLGVEGGVAGGDLSLRLWGTEQDFHQSFSAVEDGRDRERRVRDQTVPSSSLGLTAHWSRPLGELAGVGQTVVAGVDARRVEGTSRERVFLPGGELELGAGGRQTISGLFVEDVLRLSPRSTAQLALRWDRWRNVDEHAGEDGSGTAAGERSDQAWSPRLALAWQPSPTWSLRGSAYRSFRAPTLNELYRGFRVGDVVTDPNPDLTAETSTGLELGTTWNRSDAERSWRVRGTLFWMEVDDAVGNVTLEVTPELVSRERQNVGRTRSRGLELEALHGIGSSLILSAGYLWADAEVVELAADPSLEGRRVPQVPEHQATLQAVWSAPGEVRIDLQARWAAETWDDDRNLFPLDEMTLVDLRVGRPLGGGFEIFVAAENLLDEEYQVGRTPVVTLGSPRLVRLGARFSSRE